MKRGDKGQDVETLQHLLGIEVDGIYGESTEEAVEAFQSERGLYSDGIAGPRTLAALRAPGPETEVEREAIVAVPAVKLGGNGYEHIRLRASSAARLASARVELVAAGAALTSAGGIRALGASVGTNRSATSLHYLGRAFDLAMYSGMAAPERDPFVVEADGDRLWRVWARASEGEVCDIAAVTYTDTHIVRVRARVLDLTGLLARHGFERIRARPAFARRSRSSRQDGAAEWWHFQDTTGLVVGVTRFGEELRRVWAPAQLRGSGPWAHRDAVWTGGGFSEVGR
jgi:hypothetical protein